MHKIIYLAAGLMFYISLPSSAQNKLLISGTVKDEKGQPLRGAGILVGDHRIGTAADSTGHFELRVGPGNYNLIFEVAGYETSTTNAIVEDKAIEINIIIKKNLIRPVETVVRPNRYRSDWLRTFRASFIGTSANARKCRIINPDIIAFEYNFDKKILTAKANDLLIVENQAMGYRIKYLLKYFQKDEETGLVFFYGFPAFEELKGTASQNKEYLANRRLAYQGSPEHFFSALYKNTLQEEGFMVKNLVKKKNPKYVPDTTIDDNIKRVNKKVEEIDKGRYYGEALAFLKYKKRETDSVEVISRGEFRINDLLQQKSESMKTIKFDGALYVVFIKEGENERYSSSGYSIMRPDEYSAYQVSVINHSKTELGFYADGRIFDPVSIVTEGYMAYERIADMVPRDYLVTEY
jgi:hypothetical protein